MASLKEATRGKVEDLNALDDSAALNTVMYALAYQLGYEFRVDGDVDDPEGGKRTITADINDVLFEALNTIWKYKELQKD